MGLRSWIRKKRDNEKGRAYLRTLYQNLARDPNAIGALSRANDYKPRKLQLIEMLRPLLPVAQGTKRNWYHETPNTRQWNYEKEDANVTRKKRKLNPTIRESAKSAIHAGIADLSATLVGDSMFDWIKHKSRNDRGEFIWPWEDYETPKPTPRELDPAYQEEVSKWQKEWTEQIERQDKQRYKNYNEYLRDKWNALHPEWDHRGAILETEMRFIELGKMGYGHATCNPKKRVMKPHKECSHGLLREHWIGSVQTSGGMGCFNRIYGPLSLDGGLGLLQNMNQTSFSAVGADGKSYNGRNVLYNLSRCFFDRMANTTATTEAQGMGDKSMLFPAPSSYGGRKRTRFYWQKELTFFSNANIHPVKLTVFQVKCIKDCDNGPLWALNQKNTDESTPSLTNPGGAVYRTLYSTNPMYSIKHADAFNRNFKIVSTERVELAPGGQYKYSAFRKLNQLYDPLEYKEDQDTNVNEHTKGNFYTIIHTIGNVAHGNASAANTNQTFDGAYLDVIMELTTSCGEENPRGEFFDFNLSKLDFDVNLLANNKVISDTAIN